MYQLDVIKNSSLAKLLGGPPIFHDGFLKAVNITHQKMVLDIEILAQNNPLLDHDAMVRLELNNIQSFSLGSQDCEKHILTIHDLDIQKKPPYLHLKLESKEGYIYDCLFETIELKKS